MVNSEGNSGCCNEIEPIFYYEIQHFRKKGRLLVWDVLNHLITGQLQEDNTMTKRNRTKGQTTIYNSLHRNPLNTGVNSGAPEG